MPVKTSAQVVSFISKSQDPKKDILEYVGKVKDDRLMSNWVLVATYVRPEKTTGGIILPDSNVGEDEFQGKVGLVVKLGRLAFQDDEETQFGDDRAEVGDWVVYPINKALHINVNGYPCRWIRDIDILMVANNPALYF